MPQLQQSEFSPPLPFFVIVQFPFYSIQAYIWKVISTISLSFRCQLFLLFKSSDTFTDTPQNNVLPSIPTPLSPVTLMHKMNHHSSQADSLKGKTHIKQMFFSLIIGICIGMEIFNLNCILIITLVYCSWKYFVLIAVLKIFHFSHSVSFLRYSHFLRKDNPSFRSPTISTFNWSPCHCYSFPYSLISVLHTAKASPKVLV